MAEHDNYRSKWYNFALACYKRPNIDMNAEMPTPESERTTDYHFGRESEPVEAGHLFIFIGPQTGGKSSVLDYVNHEFGAKKITTITTRDPRPDDDPDSYEYRTQQQFETERANGEIVFVDHYGNGSSYGNPRHEVETLLAGENRTVIIDVPHIYELETELQQVFGDQSQQLLDHIHIFYIGVPAVRDIPIRFEQRLADRGTTDHRENARRKFKSRLISDIHSWRELTAKEQAGEVNILRYDHSGNLQESVVTNPQAPKVHLIINETGHLDDITIPTIFGIINKVTNAQE